MESHQSKSGAGDEIVRPVGEPCESGCARRGAGARAFERRSSLREAFALRAGLHLMERVTRLELATSTLARLHSTN